MNNYSKNLDEDEEIIEIVKRHPITMAGPLLIFIPLVLLDFFFLTWLFAKGYWGVILFVFVLFFSFFGGFRTWIVWNKNVFIVTNKRVVDVDQHGFFYKTVSECNYEKIQDVSYTIKGIFSTLFHFGSIQIQTAGNVANLELRHIKNPGHVQEIIMEQQRETMVGDGGNLSKDEILAAVRKVRGNIDEETIKKLFKE